MINAQVLDSRLGERVRVKVETMVIRSDGAVTSVKIFPVDFLAYHPLVGYYLERDGCVIPRERVAEVSDSGRGYSDLELIRKQEDRAQRSEHPKWH